ncbi:MAG TPA: bifunctional UDP-N-acetylglucosamine diphosphorylase/glucosamine-1-phosphate N-acetyltransferase GlmU [Gammaproteobacteria bacterium]
MTHVHNPLHIVILAAGQGTRMKSALPKVVHPIGAKPLLAHVITTAKALDAAKIHVVYGHGGDKVRAAINDPALHWVEQRQQLGTGHAVSQAIDHIDDAAVVLILYGDVPLTTLETLQPLVASARTGELGLLTALLPDPHGYGRIVRNTDNAIQRIVEQKDANEVERAIREINSGMMALPARRLKKWLGQLKNDNAQGEYYLTDIIAMAVADGVKVNGVIARDNDEILGVNDRVQLAHLERVYQKRCAERLMRQGVTISDPSRVEIRGEVTTGQDVTLDIGVILEGTVKLGNRVVVGAHCVLKDVEIGDDVKILPMSHIDGAIIHAGAHAGPFARIRPGTVVSESAHVGNFVEIKNSQIGTGSKINHLSYVGDTTMGRDVNIGAGTITCNYDGANKHRTVIGDRVFVGSDTQLVAPVTVKDGATIGAGSTITKDAPSEELTLSRSKQVTINGWKRPTKKV